MYTIKQLTTSKHFFNNYCSLLKTAEEYHLSKSLKLSKGGGLKEFFVQDYDMYEGSEDEAHFFTTEERQWLVLRLLEAVRASKDDLAAVSNLTLLEGQPIGKCVF